MIVAIFVQCGRYGVIIFLLYLGAFSKNGDRF